MDEEFLFAWEGASSPKGPWKQLRVKTFRGTESLSELYNYEIDLVCPAGNDDVDIGALLGCWGTLAIATSAQPAVRFVHGIISSVEDMADAEEGRRVRVTLAPPVVRASMMKKSIIHLDKTLYRIIDSTLERTSLGAALARSENVDSGADAIDLSSYTPPKATFGWSIQRSPRLGDILARPYCVQYDEDDWSFVSRILEEEGVAYHFEHSAEECVLMLTDNDQGGAIRMPQNDPLGPDIATREITRWRAGARLRPRSVVVDDFDMRKPALDLLAPSPSGIGPFTTIEFPGRYGSSRELGSALALVREERFDTERAYATGETCCRFLQAGSVFVLSHPSHRFSGSYLVTRIASEGRHLADFAEAAPEPFKARLEVQRVAGSDESSVSCFRPEQKTRRPRIHGTQTAIVTADPSAGDPEIWVGGEENLGSVRVRFHWDQDVGRLAAEPSSCWIRVSQVFAGASHGAMWHPRVGDEVIVDFLDGDPDRPIIVGRVYNGKDLPPENPTQKPTWSCLKTYTVPANGNYNMLAFEDQQGHEEIRIHAARDFILEALHDNVRIAGNDDSVHVKGNQKYFVDGTQTIQVGLLQQTTYLADEKHDVAGSRTTHIDGQDELTSSTAILMEAPLVEIIGDALLTLEGGSTTVIGRATLVMKSPTVMIKGGSVRIEAGGPIELVAGVNISITGPRVEVNAAEASVKAAHVKIESATTVDVSGPLVNLNC